MAPHLFYELGQVAFGKKIEKEVRDNKVVICFRQVCRQYVILQESHVVRRGDTLPGQPDHLSTRFHNVYADIREAFHKSL